MRTQSAPSYVLLNRPFSESSWIVDLFSRDHGRIALIAKGARRLKSKHRGLLLPFQPLLVSWIGKGEVPTLTNVEIDPERFQGWTRELEGRARLCGFYCNELIAGLLQRGDPHPVLFDEYQSTMAALAQSAEESHPVDAYALMRQFELAFVRESGFAVNFLTDAFSGAPISAQGWYEFVPSRGFVEVQNYTPTSQTQFFKGSVILSFSRIHKKESYVDAAIGERAESKRLMRIILTDILHAKRIVTRELFIANV